MKTYRLALACLVMAASSAYAQKACTKADEKAAEKAIERVVTYGQLSKAWQEFGHCDSGAIGDNFTDAILRLMVEWKNVETLAWDTQNHPKYKEFIQRHLLSDMAKEDRPNVHSRAKMSCPPAQDAFCGELVELLKPPK